MQDLRYAFRTLAKSPGFTVVAVLTLALGIGANTAIFSVVDAVLLGPLPYHDAGRLVMVWTNPAGSPGDRNPASLPDLTDWRADNTAFTGIAANAFNRYELNGPEGTDEARAAIVTPDFFAVLGTPPLVGRTLGPADERSPMLVLSHRLWMNRYAGDRRVIGKTVDLGEQPYTIVGVMPVGFHAPTPDIDLWTSLYPIYALAPNEAANPWITGRSFRAFTAVARLRPGVTRAAAQARMNALEQRLARSYPDADAGTAIAVQSLSQFMLGGVQRALWLLLAAAGFVLLIACANIAHLLLVRTATRGREIAVRQAVGAGRARLARQLLTESLTLATLGGMLGILVAVWGTAALVRIIPADFPRLEQVAVNGWVLAFAAAASLAAGVVFGLAPLVQAWRGRFAVLLSGAARGVGSHVHGEGLRRALMAAEVAVALVLLIGAGLMLRSFATLTRADTGIQSTRVLTFHVTVPAMAYHGAEGQRQFVQAMLARVRSLPGVRSAGAATSLPPTSFQEKNDFAVAGRPPALLGHEPIALYIPATPQFLGALGARLERGREFTDADRASAQPVAVINRHLARQYFEAEDPLDQRIVVSGVPRVIVGVVGDIPYEGLGSRPEPTIYVPFAQSPFGGVFVVLRTAMDPASLSGLLTSVVRSLDPDTRPRGLRTMDQVLSASLVRPRFQTLLLTLFGAVAVLLAAVGIYGVVAYGVAQRTGEIGLRLALGADRTAVLGLILRQGMAPVLVGLAVGLAGAAIATRQLRALLYGVAPTDALTFTAVTVFLGVVALLACVVPASRAAKVDPMEALRSE